MIQLSEEWHFTKTLKNTLDIIKVEKYPQIPFELAKLYTKVQQQNGIRDYICGSDQCSSDEWQKKDVGNLSKPSSQVKVICSYVEALLIVFELKRLQVSFELSC